MELVYKFGMSRKERQVDTAFDMTKNYTNDGYSFSNIDHYISCHITLVLSGLIKSF